MGPVPNLSGHGTEGGHGTQPPPRTTRQEDPWQDKRLRLIHP
jgi:hypothetical protein